MTSGTFSIDDAFNSDEDDKIRLYGATRDTAPFKGAKVREAKVSTSSEIPLQEYSVYEITFIDPYLSIFLYELINHISKYLNMFTSVLNFDATNLMMDIDLFFTSFQHDDQSDTLLSNPDANAKTRWWKHPRIKENCRVVIGAFALTLIGLALLITGIVIICTPQRGWHSLVFFIGGALCFIPGAYHVGYIYLAIKGHAGYNLYNLPVFR
ncbi:hypothetical protein KUTeg_010264 [Tegillarca granosa]|uniref:Transmembrane protein 134 n=1 Tax=Tegillarca granosa TaxID=220873 RepID=A0ABQ9F681_TEGGR|nr:hypothetical protein KUTeg_010264 [Tegillarca granosa]